MEFVAELSRRAKLTLPEIDAASRRSEDRLGKIRAAVAGLETSDTSMIVTGSIGRGEVTSGSDVDWFLLVDGASNLKYGVF